MYDLSLSYLCISSWDPEVVIAAALPHPSSFQKAIRFTGVDERDSTCNHGQWVHGLILCLDAFRDGTKFKKVPSLVLA